MKHGSRSLSLATLMLAAASPALGQALPVHVADGASWTLTSRHEVSTTTSDTSADTLPRVSLSMSSSKRLTFRQETDGRDALRADSLSSVVNSESPTVAALDKIPADFEVDARLSPVGFFNLDEVRAAIHLTMLQPKNASRRTKMESEATERLRLSMIGQELRVLARGQGTDLRLGEIATHDEALSSPLGGPPIAAKVSFLLESYDPQSGKAVVIYTVGIDPASMKSNFGDALEKTMKKSERKEAAEILSQISMTFGETCRYDVDIATGLAVAANCERKALLATPEGSLTMSDFWTITQTLPEAPR